jgi:hypothetical protein
LAELLKVLTIIDLVGCKRIKVRIRLGWKAELILQKL